MSTESSQHLVIGYVSGLFGVRGWVKIFSHTRPRDNIFNYQPWLIHHDNEWRSVAVLDGRMQGKGLIARLDGYDDRDLSASLINCEIAIQRTQLDELEEGEHYWVDLIGLAVINSDGQALGVVADMMETGANDVLIVRGDQQHLIPYVPGVHVIRVDTEAGQIEVDWQEPG